MTFRERLLTSLQGGRTDVMPWFADLTYWAHSRRLAGTLPPEYEGDEGFVKLHTDHHVGYYLGYAPVYSTTLENVKVHRDSADGVTTTRWETPVGEIWGQTKFLPVTASEAPIKWGVKTPDPMGDPCR